MNLNLILSMVVAGVGAFTAYDTTVPLAVRVTGAVLAGLAVIHHVAQNHANQRTETRAAASLGQPPAQMPSLAQVVAAVRQDVAGHLGASTPASAVPPHVAAPPGS